MVKPSDPTIFTLVVSHPSGRQLETTTAGFGLVRAACGELRRRYRDERGFTPIISVLDSAGHDVTEVYDR